MKSLEKFKKNITSQWGEDGLIEEIFNRIGPKSKVCVEFGAWDGKHLSNTWDLWFNKGWFAILIECDKKKSDELKKKCEDKKVQVVNALVTPLGAESIDSIIEKIDGVKKIDLMSIDIDGNEFQIFENIKKYLPRVLIIEYNPTFPPYVEFVQELNQYMGSSAKSICDMVEKRNYNLVAVTETNLIFVESEEFSLLDILPEKLNDDFIWKNISFLATSYDGTPFIGGTTPYLSLNPNTCNSIKTKWSKTKIPKFNSNTKLIPVNIRANVNFFTCFILKIKNLIKKNIPTKFIKKISNYRVLVLWYINGKPVPPPQLIKQGVIKRYAKQYSPKIFIETGTYLGDTVESVQNSFKEIYSIELDKNLFENAKNKFISRKNINIIQGDSSKVLLSILSKINEPTLFWLDGHYSAGITAKGDTNTPILKELEIILNHKIKDHIILIDDARCFIGKDDYPTISELITFAHNINPKLNIKIENDIIRMINN